MTTATTEKQCARCNGKSSKQWFDVAGVVVGIECKTAAEETAKREGVKGAKLTSIMREEYKGMMRITTVSGMILIGMLSLKDMRAKGKITDEQFLAYAKRKYREGEGKQIIADSK